MIINMFNRDTVRLRRLMHARTHTRACAHTHILLVIQILDSVYELIYTALLIWLRGDKWNLVLFTIYSNLSMFPVWKPNFWYL